MFHETIKSIPPAENILLREIFSCRASALPVTGKIFLHTGIIAARTVIRWTGLHPLNGAKICNTSATKIRKIAVFCDSEFWHGYDWERRKHDFKSRQDFWIPKIERNIARDREVLNSDRRLLNSTELHAAPIGAVFLYAR